MHFNDGQYWEKLAKCGQRCETPEVPTPAETAEDRSV